MQPTPRPRPPSASPAHWAAGLMGLFLLSAFGGWLLAQANGGAAGLCLLLVAAGLALQSLIALRCRIQSVLADITEALQRLGQGNNGFRLDSRGLGDFDALMRALHDLRETGDVVEPPPRRGPPQATAPCGPWRPPVAVVNRPSAAHRTGSAAPLGHTPC